MLRAIVIDPSPGPSVVAEQPIEYAASPSLSADLRKQLQGNCRVRYDSRNGSWGFGQKFLDWDGVDMPCCLPGRAMRRRKEMALQTLAAQLNLIDPVWGGVYQYSTDGDWKHPHFEKIMQFQAEDIRIYALGLPAMARAGYLTRHARYPSFPEDFSLSRWRLLHQPRCGLNRWPTQRGSISS